MVGLVMRVFCVVVTILVVLAWIDIYRMRRGHPPFMDPILAPREYWFKRRG